jgi:hypothetical protein
MESISPLLEFSTLDDRRRNRDVFTHDGARSMESTSHGPLWKPKNYGDLRLAQSFPGEQEQDLTFILSKEFKRSLEFRSARLSYKMIINVRPGIGDRRLEPARGPRRLAPV